MILSHSKNLPSFSIPFFHPLTNRETDILALLSLLGEFPLNPVGGMFVLGALVHPKACVVILSLGVGSKLLLSVLLALCGKDFQEGQVLCLAGFA